MIVERIRISGTCVIGKDHAKKNGVCQDRVFSLVNNGVYVASLCDGAGSKTKSHFGAEIVAKEIANFVSDNFVELNMDLETRGLDQAISGKKQTDLKERIISFLMGELNDFAAANDDVEIDDLSCTMLFVAIHDNRFITGHIGDGVIGVLKSEFGNRKLSVLSKPDNGNSPNVTFFVNDKNAANNLRLYSGELTGISGFILMSDGPEEALYSKRDGLSDNCDILFKAFEGTSDKEYKQFLTSILEKKISEISYDDLSLNIIYKESLDIESNTDEEILIDYLDDLYDNQIVRMSRYAVFIDKSIAGIGDKKNWQDRLIELKRRFDS